MYPPRQIISLLPSIQIVRGHYPDFLASFNYNSGQQPPRIRFTVVDVAKFSLRILLIDQDRTVRKALFHLFGLDPVYPNLTQIVSVPLKQTYFIVYAMHDNRRHHGQQKTLPRWNFLDYAYPQTALKASLKGTAESFALHEPW
jgi:hypothetical protein